MLRGIPIILLLSWKDTLHTANKTSLRNGSEAKQGLSFLVQARNSHLVKKDGFFFLVPYYSLKIDSATWRPQTEETTSQGKDLCAKLPSP
jgi:hypothetical protein